MLKRIFAGSLVLGCIFFTQGASADSIAYDNASSTPNNQDWGGNLGMDFEVLNNTMRVTQLGVFFGNSESTLVGTSGKGVTVGIYDIATQTLVSNSVTFNWNGLTATSTPGGTLTAVNGDIFVQLPTAIALAPGDYSIVTLGDDNYNLRDATPTGPNTTSTLSNDSGAIKFIGSSRYSNSTSTFAFPTIVDHGPVNRYDAGTFIFATPLPASGIGGLALLGACGLFKILRTRRQQQA